jgi:hypothetical protein
MLSTGGHEDCIAIAANDDDGGGGSGAPPAEPLPLRAASKKMMMLWMAIAVASLATYSMDYVQQVHCRAGAGGCAISAGFQITQSKVACEFGRCPPKRRGKPWYCRICG